MANLRGYDHFYVQPEVLDEIKKAKLETVSEGIEMYPVHVAAQEPMLLCNTIRASTVFFLVTALIFVMYIPLMETSDPISMAMVLVLNIMNFVSLYAVAHHHLPLLGCISMFEFGLWSFSSVCMTFVAIYFYPSPYDIYSYKAWYLVYVCLINFFRAILSVRLHTYIFELYADIYMAEIVIKS